jgi:2-haloacid dehalogenase
MTSTPRVDTVVFDIGNVLLDWDPRHLYRQIFTDPAEMDWFLTEVCSPDWNRAQDAGRPWTEAEAEAIARHPAYATQIRAFRARWPEMVPRTIDGTVDILRTLQSANVPLYAITNFAADTFVEASHRFPFLAEFRGVVVSGKVKLMKPEPAIYHRLAADYDLDLRRCVFIDDSRANCDTAANLGMAAIHFTAPEAARAQLARLGFAV